MSEDIPIPNINLVIDVVQVRVADASVEGPQEDAIIWAGRHWEGSQLKGLESCRYPCTLHQGSSWGQKSRNSSSTPLTQQTSLI